MQRPLRAAMLSATFGALFAAACGGSSSGGTAAGALSYTATPGNDNEYVAAYCKAQAQFQDAMGNALKDPAKLADASQFDKLYAQPFERYVKALEAAHPPSDLVKYHEALVRTLGGIIESMDKSKKIDSLISEAAKIPQPPKAAAARLQAVAANNADCQRSQFSFTGGQG
ncbi:hypothetical protein J0H33_09210 [bacterium]|jgi:hypothetical protein|nr:hypothetical protein [bacterium]